MRQRGFTLIELMIVSTVSVIVISTVGAFMTQAYRASHQSEVLTRDAVECRRALWRIEGDVRSARSIETSTGAARLIGPDGEVSYEVRSSNLVRVVDAGEEVVATGVSVFDLRTTGQLARLRISFAPHSADASHRDTEIETAIAMPRGGQ